MKNRLNKVHSTSAWRKPDLREGFTTGSCAAAATAAATRALVTGQTVSEVTIDLPVKKQVTFAIVRCEIASEQVRCGLIKDAGDDPDVTHNAEIQATVSWQLTPGITIAGGEGVGQVTKPGLPVAVGEPAINPVPRRMIKQAVLDEAGSLLGKRGINVTISVPGGEKLAQETLNPRLGIVGGISILGTTGIVKPFSQSAYRGSIYVEMKVAASNGVPQAVLTTGSRSEIYAQKRYPGWSKLGFVQVGDHMDYALKQSRRLKFPLVVISTMIGKASKMAQGRLQTHISQGGVDFEFLARLAGELGAGTALMADLRNANTAHHIQLMLNRASISGLEERLAQLAAEQASKFIGGAVAVEVLLYDMKGNLLGLGGVGKKE